MQSRNHPRPWGRFRGPSGDDSLTLPILAVGGKGVVSVVANLVPGDVSGLARPGKRRDGRSAARRISNSIPLCAMFLEINPIPVKTAMGWLDLCSRTCGCR
ncbi:MAG: dihydrodipicolinate synthase family protein [Elusimicrobia bacterium]|nr:dihydrodipicolinate synthase family protein [Elusimicrobiota bacterium]